MLAGVSGGLAAFPALFPQVAAAPPGAGRCSGSGAMLAGRMLGARRLQTGREGVGTHTKAW